MISALGHGCIVFALFLAAIGAVAAFLPNVAGARFARQMAVAVLLLVFASALAMEYALVTHDFAVKFVADEGSRETPLFYTIISLWGALEGSILFWALLLAGYTVLFMMLSRSFEARVRSYALGVLLAIATFFLFIVAFPSDPFAPVSPVPADGPGPNPLLQNHPLMALHPPLLYLGYVGLSVPFAIAMGSLLAGVPAPDTFATIRRWALLPWVFLSMGIVAGMWWSYAVLGWGGYWSWDPVENASVMPWLITTAFLHSLQVQQRRQMLKTWTLALLIGAFDFSILGTLLTRSGVVASVHAFTQSAVGPLFLGFFTVVLAVSLGLLFARSKDLAAPGSLDAVVCRETVFLANNLLFVAATFTILLGTIFPLIAEALRGTQLSVGAPYFNNVNLPVGLAILFLMGVGPALPWGVARLDELQYALLVPVAAGVGMIVALLLLGARGIGTLATFGLATFVFAVTLSKVTADVAARRHGTGENPIRAARCLFRANPRRYGGYLTHIGVLLAVAGIAASQSYGLRAAATLRPGQSMQIGGYTLTYTGFQPIRQPNRMVLQADVLVRRDGRDLGMLTPSQNMYPTMQQPVVTPAVREEPFDLLTGLLRGHDPLPDLAPLTQRHNPFEDLYLVLEAIDTSNANQHVAAREITLQAMVNPMVDFIWLGGFLMALGGVCALLPRCRRVAMPVAEPVRLQAEEVTV